MTPKIKKFRKSSKKQINWDRGSKSNKNCNKNNKKIFLNVFHQTITIWLNQQLGKPIIAKT